MKRELYCQGCTEVILTAVPQPGAEWECPVCGERGVVPEHPIGPGTIIGGYRIVEKIGVGGMGGVYLAEQMSMNRHVALKVLPPALYADPTLLDRFLGEVRMLGSLRHPSIATAYDAGNDQRFHYLAMEYIDGSDLHALIQKQGVIDEGDALWIAGCVAEGLGYAWSRDRLVHRDIKPGNIMIDREDKVKILDLGVSMTGGTDFFVDGEDTVLGTPHYMSPEQALGGDAVDVRADIYSLGATLYHMLTGHPPFRDEQLAELFNRRSGLITPSVGDRNPDVSPACVVLIEIMMARDPADRQADWAECHKDIQRVAAGKPPMKPRPALSASVMARTGAGVAIENPAPRPSHQTVFRHVVVAIVFALGLIFLVVRLTHRAESNLFSGQGLEAQVPPVVDSR